MSHRLAKFMQGFTATEPAPQVRWEDLVRIDAMGTDAFSAFQIWLTFTYRDGTKLQVTVEMKGYWDIVDSLHTRLPSISPTWYEEMAARPWHTEEVLYTRDENEF
ncbi:MAG TPA: hypothetical protein VN673_01095 [Clostridia bacterium]|nr:hypothetical protein [Clostridia bacterium]